MSDLATKKCIPCEGHEEPLSRSEADKYLAQVPGWELAEDSKSISRKFKFKNFAEALAFTNKIGQIAESAGHHPDLKLGWGYVHVKFTTHVIRGLSENDFILAAKINKLFPSPCRARRSFSEGWEGEG